MTDPRDEAAFVERVARVLREPEMLDLEFERRVSQALRAERRSWWRRPRVIEATPLRASALAAGFGGLMVLGGFAAARQLAPAPAPVAVVAADTVHLVRFVIAAPGASRVALVGDFNGWSDGVTLLRADGEDGLWSVSLPLAAGRHEYAFVVDGVRWMADPLAPRHRDEFGTESSVLRLSAGALPGT